MTPDPEIKEYVSEAKRNFFVFRDGLTADVLRRGGVPHTCIFGLQVPRISQVASRFGSLPAERKRMLARCLWEDADVRESRLLACWLMDSADLSHDDALALASSVRSQEEADILVFRVLSRIPDRKSLLDALDDSPPHRMAARALSRSLDH